MQSTNDQCKIIIREVFIKYKELQFGKDFQANLLTKLINSSA